MGDVDPVPVRHTSATANGNRGEKTTSSALFQTAPPAFDVDMKWMCVCLREREEQKGSGTRKDLFIRLLLPTYRFIPHFSQISLRSLSDFKNGVSENEEG